MYVKNVTSAPIVKENSISALFQGMVIFNFYIVRGSWVI